MKLASPRSTIPAPSCCSGSSPPPMNAAPSSSPATNRSEKRTCSRERVPGNGLSCTGSPFQPAFVDVVGEVDGGALGAHSERGGDELGIQGVDQLGEAGAAEQLWPDACWVEDVAEVVGRRRVLCALGLPGDQDVLVGGAELGAVVQAPLQGGPGGRVQGRGGRPPAELDSLRRRVDVGGDQAA